MNPRQKQITDAAITLFLADGVTVSTARIANAAGVSNGTLFNAFPSKQALIDGIYVATKTGMFDALTHSGQAAMTRAAFHENWCDYLNWARAFPEHRSIMHLLLDAGLVSEDARNEVNAHAAPVIEWLGHALAHGTIRGPSVAYVGELAFFHLDLAITHDLDGADLDLSFDMLCQAIGLKP